MYRYISLGYVSVYTVASVYTSKKICMENCDSLCLDLNFFLVHSYRNVFNRLSSHCIYQELSERWGSVNKGTVSLQFPIPSNVIGNRGYQ